MGGFFTHSQLCLKPFDNNGNATFTLFYHDNGSDGGALQIMYGTFIKDEGRRKMLFF